ncbi:MAG: cell division protein FtsQ/DivIB [Halanaerobiales bacterium]
MMSQNTGLLLILAILTVIGVISYLGSPFFAVENIYIDKLDFISREEIRKSLVQYKGENIWLVDKSRIRAALKENKFIKDLQITKKIPNTINILIEERIPVAAINNNGRYIVFDREGYILAEGAVSITADIPLLKDFGYSFSGEKIIFTEEVEEIIHALTYTDRDIRARIKHLEYNDGELTLKLVSGTVLMGDLIDLEKKFRVFNSVMDRQLSENENVEYIDLRIVEKPVIK